LVFRRFLVNVTAWAPNFFWRIPRQQPMKQ
jgi:hypothetical protein